MKHRNRKSIKRTVWVTRLEGYFLEGGKPLEYPYEFVGYFQLEDCEKWLSEDFGERVIVTSAQHVSVLCEMPIEDFYNYSIHLEETKETE